MGKGRRTSRHEKIAFHKRQIGSKFTSNLLRGKTVTFYDIPERQISPKYIPDLKNEIAAFGWWNDIYRRGQVWVVEIRV